MYAHHGVDYSAGYNAHAHRFNPNAPAFRGGYAASYGNANGMDAGYAPLSHYPADAYAPHPMNAAMLAEQQQAQAPQRGYGNDAHQASFGSSNTSFSGPSTPAMSGAVASNTKRSRYTHNPYASSNASNSEPTSPALAPISATQRVPADAAFYSSMSSANASNLQSPVYAPEGTYGDSAVHHPIAFSINEQFAQARGNLAAAACSPRGRHMLVGALRQQHTDKIQAIFDELAPNVAHVVMDPQGGHVIRTLIEFLNEAQVAQLVEFLTPEVVLTVATSSQNSRRVLQTLFERHRTPALQPVINVIALHAIALSTTQQGCIAVMRCLEHTAEVQKLQVLSALQPQLAALTMDPYGNYVVQAILQYFPRETACEVIEKAFAGHWVNLSCNKFASNVMEKFIQASTPLTRKTILEELVFDADALGTLMQDGFGNFVLQQIIDTCTTGPEYRKMAEKVRPLLASSPFGHKIEAKLKSKRFGPPYESGAGAGSGTRDANVSPNAAPNAKRGKKTDSKEIGAGPRRPQLPKGGEAECASSSRSTSNMSSAPSVSSGSNGTLQQA